MALIFTTKGNIEESLLTKTEGNYENENEIVKFQEWVLDGEIVKREVQMQLKQGIQGFPDSSM